MARISFYGAAETVTGSKYLVEAGNARVMVDYGAFQGLKSLRELNWNRPAFDPKSLDAIVLTHAHIDHIGLLPRLVNQGYKGPVYGTPPTVELAALMLLDSAHINESDAAYANRKGYSKHHPALPLFDTRDVHHTLRLMKAIRRDAWFEVAPPIWIRYHDAGHLLGSAMIEMEIREGPKPLRILFSGDVGRYGAPLYFDPTPPPPCDYLVCESTYGDRDHPEGDLLDALAEVVRRVIGRGGVMVMAAFAVGRAQQLIYLLEVLMAERRIPEIKIFLDSPMAVDATELFCKYSDDHDLSEGKLPGRACAINGPHLTLIRTTEHSKLLNQIGGPAVIVSSSGMMTQGRILHHLRHRLPDRRNTIILGGFQAAGTRGRQLEERAKFIRLHHQDVPVRAAIEKIPGMSGHADRGELLKWLAPLPAPRHAFLTHGEKPAADALAETLRRERNWNVAIPRLGQTYELLSPS
ncbi:MAG: MBL fold metallo-hydrolase [Planctomycetota bacterium]|nr:MAG: MBL fold metallo-hydrolase [Planctomycetota bacterium]